MNLRDRMKEAKPSDQKTSISKDTMERSKLLLEEQSKQIKCLTEQNESLTSALQKSEAERQRLISESSGLKRELQRKSEEIVTLRESDKNVKELEQKLNELHEKQQRLKEQEAAVTASVGNVERRAADVRKAEKLLENRKAKLQEEIESEAMVKARVMSKEKVDAAEKAQKEAEEVAESADAWCVKAWIVVIFALVAVAIRSAPLLTDIYTFFSAIGKGVYILFALCPMAYAGASSWISGKGGIVIGVLAFILVLAIVLGICGAVIVFTGKYLVKHFPPFLMMGVMLVYLQGVIKEQDSGINLAVLWVLAYIGFQVAAFIYQDYIKAREESYY